MAATADIRIRADISAAQRGLASLTDKSKAYASAAAQAETRIGAAAAKTNKSILERAKIVGKETQAYKELAKAAEEAAAAKTKFGREQLGDISTSLGSIGSVAGAFGGGASTEALRFGGDVAGALEYAGKFKQSILDAGKAAAESGGLLGSIASAAQKAKPGLDSSSAGLLAIGAAAAPIAATTVAIASFVGMLDQARQAAEKDIEVEKTRARLLAEQAQALKDGDFSGAQKMAEDARKEINLLSAEKEAVLKLRDDAQKQYDSLASGDLIGRSYWRAEIDTFNSELDRLGNTITENSSTAAHLEAALKSTAGQAAKTSEELKKQVAIDVDVAKKRLAEEEKLNKEYANSLATVAQLKQQQEDLNRTYRETSAAIIEQRKLEDARRNEDRAIAEKREQEDLDRALALQATQHADEMLAIAQRADDAILAARQSIVEKEIQTAKQAAALIAQYQADELKAVADFNKAQARQFEDYRKSRKRALEDQAASELEALIDNDIGAIITGRSRFKTDRRREREDFRDERARAREDFAAEREAAKAALDAKLADLATELTEYTNATNAKIAQIEAQKQADLLAAETAYQARLKLDEESRAIINQREEEDLALDASRRAQDRAAEDTARIVSHSLAMQQIAEKSAAETAIADGLLFKLQQVQTLLQQTSAGVLDQARNPSKYTGAGGSQLTNPTSPAAPSKTKPIAPSNVIPISPQLSRRNDVGRGGDGNGGLQITQNINVGEFVTPTQLEQVTNEVQKATVDGWVKGVMQARTQRQTG